MVERIDGPHRELDVALGVDVVAHLECNVGNILHVHVLIDHDNALGEHSLPQRPDRVHDLPGLSRIRLANRHQHQIMEHAFHGQIDVHDLRDRQLHHGQKNALDSLAHEGVFHRRLANNRRRINRILTVRDAGSMKDRVFVGQRIKPCMVAKRTFRAKLVEVNVALEDNLGVGRNFEVDGFALHEFDRLLPQESGNHVLLHLGRRGNDGGKSQRRVGSDGYRHFHLARRPTPFRQDGATQTASHDVNRGGCARRIATSGGSSHQIAHMFRGNFLALPMHARSLLVVYLDAVHADIALARLRIARDHARQRNEAPSVVRPALQNREVQQREFVFANDFLARSAGNSLRKELAHLGQHGQHLHLIQKSLRRLHVHEVANAVGNLVERINFQRQLHAAL